MKPLGISSAMRVVMPSKAEDKIWDAVEEAIEAGWTPQRFKNEVANAWAEYFRRTANDTKKVLLGF
jgi:hypothetical protein